MLVNVPSLPPACAVPSGALDLRIAKRVHERVLAVGRPKILENGGIPHHLVHDLGKTDRVRVGTRPGRLKGASSGVSNMALVIGAVDVLAVPTSEGVCQQQG